jgi:hypothetical protein
VQVTHSLSAREKEIMFSGGLLNYTRQQMEKQKGPVPAKGKKLSPIKT